MEPHGAAPLPRGEPRARLTQTQTLALALTLALTPTPTPTLPLTLTLANPNPDQANLVLVDGNNNTHHWTSLLRQPQPTARGAVAILDREERAAYWYTHDGIDADTGASLLKEQTAAFAGVTAGTERRTQTLDGLLARLHGGRPPPRGVCGLLKLDVQGAELSVLQGAIRCLAQAEAVLLEIGVAGSYNLGAASFAEHVAFLDAQGFSLFDVGEQHRMGPASLGTDGVLFQLDLLFVRTGDRFNRAAQAALYNIPHDALYNRTQRYTLYSYTSRSGPMQAMHTPLWRTSGAGRDQPLRKRAEGRGGGRRGRTGASALKSAKATFEPSVDRSRHSFHSPTRREAARGSEDEGRVSVAPLPACSRATIKNIKRSGVASVHTLYTARQKPYLGPMRLWVLCKEGSNTADRR